MKGVLPWLVHWARCAATRDLYPALDSQIGPLQNIFFFLTRETREGWPLLSVDTEPNRDSRSTYERGLSLVGLLGSFLCRYKRFFLPCLGCSNRPLYKIFFLHRNYLNLFRQAVVPGRLSPNMCLW